ncbi:MAG: pyridoxal phosphate-dependent aminotransferase family protein [Bacteroidetes bacterium]|nr:pyridoxal phosphate-dependent aminotransferase family protein [Bacteroidota bacterium]
MSASIQNYINQRLQQRKDDNNFRSLKVIEDMVDFTSNDYIGFAQDKALTVAIEAEVKQHHFANGSTGSRLLSGNSAYAEEVECFIANYHNAEAALVFNSGFTANYGLLSSLPYKGDTIIYDELVHASIHDGIKNSKADSLGFKHNDVSDLEQALQQAKGLKYVVVESVYSMDGDLAPLKEIAALCNQYDAGLIVDEAHATGVYGNRGEGLVGALDLEDACLARIHTYGKAMGVHGAAIVCSNDLKAFLVNYCRAFIYTTFMSFHSLAAIKCAYKQLANAGDNREHLFNLIKLLRSSIQLSDKFTLIEGNSPVQSIVVAGNNNVKAFAQSLQAQGFDVRPILTPTVAKGQERIRICLHSFNTEQEVLKLAEAINKL